MRSSWTTLTVIVQSPGWRLARMVKKQIVASSDWPAGRLHRTWIAHWLFCTVSRTLSFWYPSHLPLCLCFLSTPLTTIISNPSFFGLLHALVRGDGVVTCLGSSIIRLPMLSAIVIFLLAICQFYYPVHFVIPTMWLSVLIQRAHHWPIRNCSLFFVPCQWGPSTLV
jgi:hypothetical protein